MVNYLCNCLSTKTEIYKIILEKYWIGEKQDVKYVKIFGSIVNIVITKKKSKKFNI